MILQAENLYFSYGQKLKNKEPELILKGINLQLEQGQSLAIVGSSGSGKSTLLHLLAGLDRPSQGSVRLCDQPFSSESDDHKSALRNRYMGFVYQFHHLLAEFTALENVALPLLIAQVPKEEANKRAVELLERVGLGRRLDHLPAELSGGERQRTAIARALVNNPACLLADEPTGNLDNENARQAFNLMRELISERGSALVVVTHDLELARQMDRCYQLQNGLLKE